MPCRDTRRDACREACREACRDAATLDFRKRWLSMSYKMERGNVAFFWLRFHAIIKILSDYQSVTKDTVAASRQLAPEVIMVMFMSPLDAPRRGWDLWRFASLIPSGCRLPPIHKVRPLKKTLELKARENRIFEHDSTFFTFRLNNRFSESYFYR